MNASCTGCRPPPASPAPFLDKPSIVVTSRPSHCAASVRHDSTRLPPASTVHAPHAPWSHPFFVPVSPSRSRSASSNVTRLSSRSRRALPLTCSVTSTSVEARFVSDMELIYFASLTDHAVWPDRQPHGDVVGRAGKGVRSGLSTGRWPSRCWCWVCRRHSHRHWTEPSICLSTSATSLWRLAPLLAAVSRLDGGNAGEHGQLDARCHAWLLRRLIRLVLAQPAADLGESASHRLGDSDT